MNVELLETDFTTREMTLREYATFLAAFSSTNPAAVVEIIQRRALAPVDDAALWEMPVTAVNTLLTRAWQRVQEGIAEREAAEQAARPPLEHGKTTAYPMHGDAVAIVYGEPSIDEMFEDAVIDVD